MSAIYAVIKKTNRYAYQQPRDGKAAVPFEVKFAAEAMEGYIVYGNGNQYCVTDLNFFVRNQAGKFVRLS